MKYFKCIKCGKKSAWVTFWGNVGLVIFKGFAGVMGGSHALIADALHSAADVVIALITIIALAISGKVQDKNHPYGHGKIEFIAASVVTAGLLAAVGFLFMKALEDLKSGLMVKPEIFTFFVAVIAIIGSELMFRYNLCSAKELKSPALKANAWHNRYDVYTSIVVAVGILGAKAGLEFLDPVAAIFVGIVIIKIAVNIFKEAYKGLMDVSIPADDKKEIEKIVMQVKGVKEIKSIKARYIGQKLWVDLAIKVTSSLTVDKGYIITERVREFLLLKMENISGVQVIVNNK